jgi:hypothetical protein
VTAWQRAGKRAGGRGAMVEAERHYTRALDLLGALPDTPDRGRHEFGLQMALGMVLWGTKGWSVAQTYRAFARAQELGERLGETRQLVTVLSGEWTSALTRGQMGTAQELADRLLRAAERSGSAKPYAPPTIGKATRSTFAASWRSRKNTSTWLSAITTRRTLRTRRSTLESLRSVS